MIHGESATYMGTQQIIVKSLGKKLSDSYRIGKKGVGLMPITTGKKTKTLINFAVVYLCLVFDICRPSVLLLHGGCKLSGFLLVYCMAGLLTARFGPVY
mgnify:CR=1 FL=1